jgi:hypothetical protein
MSGEHFDRYQFEKPNAKELQAVAVAFRHGDGRCDEFSIDRQVGLDIKDLEGMQIQTVRGRKHRDTLWAKDTKRVLRLLRRVFPHVWVSDRPMRVRYGYRSAARWLEVVRLYFVFGWDANSTGERLHCTQSAVEGIVRRIRLARHGMSQHGERFRKPPHAKDDPPTPSFMTKGMK